MSDDDTVPEAALAEARARAEALEARLAALQHETETRLLRAEMKAEALRAGMVDTDGLKMVDFSNLKLGDDGTVEGAAGLMSALRREKPWLFAGASSSAPTATPPAAPAVPRKATEMTETEYRAARAELLKRSF